ncbi:undecaprenyldiphospho-muramoylpentapeptide beta-N-acetylglucosaminyltransferase [Parahaliea mediterranea]|uniref:UDP-N-acetylglucosamine--N-acetylmuramyl-(pentapeptide) pyrophosphoryl-undecaprenol N-acetylglucosamine transferase n=1 Tax=Parahaliea mediterranea TaxID=651086 RepID=A0A939IKX2_9GAMM|nr:undecaprenyldiphospho-muramoylpentapeptide beta-N-acetylglucosaminyltransferase [Parahaliea mediterranea]MBN7795378.1 undecaprenyldiphospho-muramoylpentapeptide beta-N-acetylglucosaminyltransferase [Parahaliea mediterranea]
MSRALHVLMMAGGTGGHVYPALAVARELQDRGHSVEWVGTQHGMESRVVPQAGIALHYLAVRGVRGKNLLQTVQGLLRLVFACFQALALVARRGPDCVVGMGGYAAGPAGLAAWLLRRPLLIHEQNAVAGTTNRLLAPLARCVAAGFPGAFGNRADVRELGNPVRGDLLRAGLESAWTFDGSRPLRLLVLGGSLGARAINEVVPVALERLSAERGAGLLEVWHQTGADHIDAVKAAYGALVGDTVRVAPFIDDMAAAYGWADLVLCRAGALTVAELAIMGRPALLVPLPQAIDNHQYWNARSLTDRGAGLMLEQKTLDAGSLASAVRELVDAPERLAAMAGAARDAARPDATARVADCCEELCDE